MAAQARMGLTTAVAAILLDTGFDAVEPPGGWDCLILEFGVLVLLTTKPSD